MKRNLIIAILAISPFLSAYSALADSSPVDSLKKYTWGGNSSVLFSQLSLSNWAKGGESSLSLTSILSLFSNYKDSSLSWDNNFDAGFGFVNSDEFGYRKNDDKIELNSKLGYKATTNLNYTVLLNFKSQFAEGFNFPDDSNIVSKWFAPAYLITSVGMEYKPHKNVTMYLSPLAGRFIWVMDQRLADSGAYSVQRAQFDPQGVLIKHGEKFRTDLGAYFTGKASIDLMEAVTLQTKLDLFNNYSDPNKNNRKNIDVNFENTILLKVNKYISANVFAQFIYDQDIPVPLYKTINGLKTQVGAGPRLQVKEQIGVGFSYKF